MSAIAAVAGESGRETLRLNAALIAESYGRLLDATGNPARAADVWSEALRSLAAESAEAPGLVQQALRARLIARLGRKDEAQRLAEDLRRSGIRRPAPAAAARSKLIEPDHDRAIVGSSPASEQRSLRVHREG